MNRFGGFMDIFPNGQNRPMWAPYAVLSSRPVMKKPGPATNEADPGWMWVDVG
jgi:hypothetical protein